MWSEFEPYIAIYYLLDNNLGIVEYFNIGQEKKDIGMILIYPCKHLDIKNCFKLEAE